MVIVEEGGEDGVGSRLQPLEGVGVFRGHDVAAEGVLLHVHLFVVAGILALVAVEERGSYVQVEVVVGEGGVAALAGGQLDGRAFSGHADGDVAGGRLFGYVQHDGGGRRRGGGDGGGGAGPGHVDA